MDQLYHSLDIVDASTYRDFVAAEHNTPSNVIRDGMRFSLAFIITYQYSLLALTALFTARHCLNVLSRTRRTLCHQVDVSIESRIQHGDLPADTEHLKSAVLDEHTSLLVGRRQKRPALYQRTARRWRSLFIHHPTWLRELPGNDISFFVFLLAGLNLFYALYNAPLSRPVIYVFADRVGLLFVANLPWLYLLGAKNQPFRLLTGSSYEGLNILHRSLGKWLAILAALHTVGMVIVWYDYLLPRGLGLWWYLTRNIIWLGISALLCYEVLSLTSLVSFRQWWYEMFLACHIVLQAGGLIFLFFHFPRTRPYVLVSLSIFLLDRLWYRLTLKTRSFVTDLTIMEDGQTVMVSASWALQPWSRALSWLVPRDVRYGWNATDHVFLTVPALSGKHKMQAHPFTIASAAPAKDHTHAWLSLIIRVRDGFTRDLLEHAKLNTTATVRLDGPYGSDHALEMLLVSDLSVVVAGGSGIAVAFPLIWELLHAPRARLSVCLIWIVNDARHVKWIGYERIDELKQLGLRVVIPPPTAKAGRPDVPQLLRQTLVDLTDGDLNCKTGLVVSGPDAMNRAVRNTCAQLAWDGMNISVAVEVFDW
ncbi:hypothetical protein AMS68_001057 [Peltaster fructicola]|uniref:FAD-binding FR-type domain-containing protein n=1 Tax=Peltaster fructicola TaxID=286661 RepID=A0A6H0XM12_9PEZI|nr:hypothetical protein AMS68_001057 [Peltaster fructicola]